ncbi:unnamed protein product [Ixodes persulcatus]
MPSYGSYCCVAWCGNNGRTCKKPGTMLHSPVHWSRNLGVIGPLLVLFTIAALV